MEAQQPAGAPPPVQLNVGDALGYGFGALKRYPGPLVIITLVYIVVAGLANGLASAFQDVLVLQVIFTLVSAFVGILLYMGLIRVALKVTAGEEPEVGDLFKPEHFGSYLLAGVIVGVAVAVGLVFCIVPGIYLAIMLGFFGFVVLARGAGAIDSIKASAAITEGNRGNLFVLGLAIFGLNLAGALACGFGLLVTYPITTVALGYAYRVLSNEPVAPVEAA